MYLIGYYFESNLSSHHCQPHQRPDLQKPIFLRRLWSLKSSELRILFVKLKVFFEKPELVYTVLLKSIQTICFTVFIERQKVQIFI